MTEKESARDLHHSVRVSRGKTAATSTGQGVDSDGRSRVTRPVRDMAPHPVAALR